MKNESKKDIRYIVLGIALLILLIGLSIFVRFSNKKIVVVINDKVIGYIDKQWKDVNNTSQVFGKYNFDVYDNLKYKGKYELNYVNDRWYFFDNNNDSYSFSGNIVAVSNKKDVIVEESVSTNYCDDNDIQSLNPFLQAENINVDLYDENTYKYKIEYDFDKDGKKEIVYSINNLESDTASYFTMLLYKNEEKIEKMFYETKELEYKDDLPIFSLDYVITLSSIKKHFLIITSAKNLDVNSTYNMVYSFSNNTFKLEKGYSEDLLDMKVVEKDYFGTTVIIIIFAIMIIAAVIAYVIRRQKSIKNEI